MGKTVFNEKLSARLDSENSSDSLVVHNEKKALAAFNSQIAGTDALIIDLEMEVDQAKESLNSRILPVDQIGDVKRYCQGIVDAQSAVDSAEAKLTNAKETLAYFKKLRKEYFNK